MSMDTRKNPRAQRARAQDDRPKHRAPGQRASTTAEHKHDAHEEEKIVRLTEAKRKELGIEVATAQPGSLKTQLSLTGTISINTDRFVRIVSRIPGIVREVPQELG